MQAGASLTWRFGDGTYGDDPSHSARRFLSDQTFTDSVIALNNYVLSVKMVRDSSDE